MEKMAYSIREATDEGAGSRSVIYEAIKNGSLRARKRGRSTVILAADLTEYLESLPDFHHEQAAA